ncbi:AAA family ATPase [Terriglobus albidus]|uniref:AAA family ATPase n=2 Tax=Terriglobus albidus TaxID=1592106 RepID=A0A5B9EM57_9BACT|nr:AAA family ATPase [Terriglobus albidus]
MARSDLLVSLVKAGTCGDSRGFRSAAEAIIAEERAKQHGVLADRLTKAIQVNGTGNIVRANFQTISSSDPHYRGKDFISEVVPRRRLDDLILPLLARQNVLELIEEQQRADLLRAHGLEPRNRILLVGPPGTGKTTLAEAIAEAVSVPLFVVRYEAMIGSYLGETASRLKRVVDYAKTTPCVLFFDEFDAIGKERGDIHETGEIKRVVSTLLMQIDDLPSYAMVAAATNHPELLDRAAWRRFQVRVQLELPTRNDLAKYLENFLIQFRESAGISAATLAKALGHISYADAEQFCLDVRRRQVLAAGERSLKQIVADQLRIWTAKSRAQQPKPKEKEDADATSASTSHTEP